MKALIVCAVRRKFRGSQPEMGGMISSDWRVITTFQFRWGGGKVDAMYSPHPSGKGFIGLQSLWEGRILQVISHIALQTWEG